MKTFFWIFLMIYLTFVENTTAYSEDEMPKICPELINRTRWGGRTPLEVEHALVPIRNVIIHHTVTPECKSETSCSELITGIQNFHMENLGFHDIGYNFLVGGDGRIYEGAGWHKVGAHTKGYNSRSLGLAFIGNFSEKVPNETQLQAVKNFLQCAVELGELHEQYKLFGARQVSATESPGLKLHHEIQKWPHFVRFPS